MIAVENQPSGTAIACEELAACPWCGGARFRQKWTSFDRLHLVSRQRFSYQHCRDCGLIFQSPRPSEDAIHAFYPENYGPYTGTQRAAATTSPRRSIMRRFFAWTAEKTFRKLVTVTDSVFPRKFEKRYLGYYQPPAPGAALLDFGCGSDRFLNQARTMGWQTTGMDFSPQAVEQARASGHRAFLCNDEAWDELADGSFQFVRLSHVLEHLYHPRDVLTMLARKMAPGALLHLALPNPRSLSSKVFGSRWFSLDCPRHIMLYSSGFLRRELPQFGFEMDRVLHEPVTKDFARSWAYRLIDKGRLAHTQIDGYLEHRLLNDGMAVPMRILAGCGVGERIHIFARRKPAGAA